MTLFEAEVLIVTPMFGLLAAEVIYCTARVRRFKRRVQASAARDRPLEKLSDIKVCTGQVWRTGPDALVHVIYVDPAGVTLRSVPPSPQDSTTTWRVSRASFLAQRPVLVLERTA